MGLNDCLNNNTTRYIVMKLFRLLTTVSLSSLAMAVGSWFPALALDLAEINLRLQEIPVFTVTDGGGSPIVANLEEQLYAGVFINPQDAIAFRESVIQENPTFQGQVKVTSASLEEIYALDRQQTSGNTAEESIDFVYVPTAEQITAAENLIPKDAAGQPQFALNGVPLFAVKVRSANATSAENDSAYITLPRTQTNAQGEQVEAGEFVPFFFSQAQAQALAQQYDTVQTQRGNSERTAVLEVHTLEILLDNWERRDDPGLAQIWLVPAPESLEYIRREAQSGS